MRSRLAVLALAVCGGSLLAGPATAEVFLSKREAIEQAFPDADAVSSKTHVVDDEMAAALQKRARARLETRLITVHTATKDGVVQGHAIIDVHPVRTLPEAFLVVMTPDGRVRDLRLLAFYEPPEYAPPPRWLAFFTDRRLEPSLRLGGDIHSIAGSTLSSRAVTESVRRALAAFELLVDHTAPVAAKPAAPGSPGTGPKPVSVGTSAGGR